MTEDAAGRRGGSAVPVRPSRSFTGWGEPVSRGIPNWLCLEPTTVAWRGTCRATGRPGRRLS
jgi:hypothetical protein